MSLIVSAHVFNTENSPTLYLGKVLLVADDRGVVPYREFVNKTGVRYYTDVLPLEPFSVRSPSNGLCWNYGTDSRLYSKEAFDVLLRD